MTKVLLIVTDAYPDMDAVHERILAGSKREGVTAYRRANDHGVKGIAEVLGVEIPEYISQWRLNGEPVHFGGNAYLEECLNAMDLVVVYGTTESTVTDYWIAKSTKYPYDLMYAHKIELNIAKAKKTRKKANKKVAT